MGVVSLRCVGGAGVQETFQPPLFTFAIYLTACEEVPQNLIDGQEVNKKMKKNEENENLKKLIIEEVEKSKIPIGISAIARAIGVSWNRAARLTFALAAKEEVAAIPTGIGWVFMSRKRIKIRVSAD